MENLLKKQLIKPLNMSYTYILCTCNKHKQHKSASLICSFEKDEESKVLQYIETHLNAFFDGSEQTKKERFKSLFKSTLEKSNIVDAINSNLDIYAMVQAIPQIPTN